MVGMSIGKDVEYIKRVCGLYAVTWSSVLLHEASQVGLSKMQRRLEMLEHNEDALARFLAQNDISASRIQVASLMLSQTRRYITAINESMDELVAYLAEQERRNNE